MMKKGVFQASRRLSEKLEGFFMRKTTKSEDEIITKTMEKLAEIALGDVRNDLELMQKISEITEEEIVEMAIKWSRKCEGIEFTPYIDEKLQKQFYCMFDALVEIEEVVKVDGENKKVCYEKTYKKDDFAYSINWLNIASIKMLMRSSLKCGCDLILESITNVGMKEISISLNRLRT